MKVTYTQVLSRKILLAFLALIIILSIAAFFVRDSISERLEKTSKMADSFERDEAKPQQVLLLLHQAEDDFQESLLDVNNGKSAEYKIKLSKAFDEIDTLLKANKEESHLAAPENKKVQGLYYRKLKLSDKLYTLKHNFDSLLTAYANFDLESGKKMPNLIKTEHSKQNVVKNNVDTVRKEVVVKKKGLFSRLKDAISNKNGNGTGKEIIEINHNQVNNLTKTKTSEILTRDRTAYLLKLQQLQQRNTKLLIMQRELISLNSHITGELERIINEIKEINFNITDQFKTMAFKSYVESTALLNKFYLAALFLVLIFAGLLIIFIIKLNKSEVLLRKENQRSVIIAQQKMDLLLHMSHEIRNPLTAIKGFLYIFSQTTLSKRQSDMLDSIRMSSDMLLSTLNDTLDAAKMENSEFKINSDPFNPDFTLKGVIESMEFSAAKKKLNISYEFNGDKEAILLGDSFRLKQIMINLLSNAIKYTNVGSITVKAVLQEVQGETRLAVDVIDTGAGISTEQQANLFSKYYQTNSAKGNTGTGLGLYICKQFIRLQKGNISVKSAAGEGSTFSFYIPYLRSSEEEALSTENAEDPLSLLNGISILAVDDNELNLRFLNMMTSKWNVKFHQAGNGKEALNIIHNDKITVVLTDIQMPEMNGLELMKAIRTLDEPLNKIPVIVISGGAEVPEIGKPEGFSGLVSKPFVETELIEQIVKALKV